MFYVNNLDVRQSRQANDSASIAKRAKDRFRNCESFAIAIHAAPSLTFAIAKSVFGALCNTSDIIGLS